MKQVSYKIPWFSFSVQFWHNKKSYEGLQGEDEHCTIQILLWCAVLVGYVFNTSKWVFVSEILSTFQDRMSMVYVTHYVHNYCSYTQCYSEAVIKLLFS